MINNLIMNIINKYNNNIVVISFVAIYDRAKLLRGKYSIKSDENMGGVIILDSPVLIDKGYNDNDIRRQGVFSSEQIKFFVEKMKENIPKENLVLMYNNLKNLKVRENDFLLVGLTILIRGMYRAKKGVVGGLYSLGNNKIVAYSQKGDKLSRKLFNSNSNLTLEGEYSHELLHMSSTIKKKNKVCSGFSQFYILPYSSFAIGRMFSEGYTDLLNKRLFGADNNGGLYEFYREASAIIEEIVGQDEMMDLYFGANLNGLVNELGKYTNKNNVKKFLIDLDLMVTSPEKINTILEFILRIYSSMIEYKIVNKLITREEGYHLYQNLKTKIVDLTKIFEKCIVKKRKIDSDTLYSFNIRAILSEQYNNYGVKRY